MLLPFAICCLSIKDLGGFLISKSLSQQQSRISEKSTNSELESYKLESSLCMQTLCQCHIQKEA